MLYAIDSAINGFKIKAEAYYYTLSTISQTLAAMIALIGMFAVFRLQYLKDEKDRLYGQLENLAIKANEKPHNTYVEVQPDYNTLFKLHDLDDEERINKLTIFFSDLSKISEELIPHQVRPLIKSFEKRMKKINDLNEKSITIKEIMRQPSFYSLISISVSIFFLAFLTPFDDTPGAQVQFYAFVFIVALSAFSIIELVGSLAQLLKTD